MILLINATRHTLSSEGNSGLVTVFSRKYPNFPALFPAEQHSSSHCRREQALYCVHLYLRPPSPVCVIRQGSLKSLWFYHMCSAVRHWMVQICHNNMITAELCCAMFRDFNRVLHSETELWNYTKFIVYLILKHMIY